MPSATVNLLGLLAAEGGGGHVSLSRGLSRSFNGGDAIRRRLLRKSSSVGSSPLKLLGQLLADLAAGLVEAAKKRCGVSKVRRSVSVSLRDARMTDLVLERSRGLFAFG